MHHNMSILSPLISNPASGGNAGSGATQQGAAGLGGLFSLNGGGPTASASFDTQLALVMKSLNAGQMKGDALTKMGFKTSGTAQTVNGGGTLPPTLLQNGPMSGKGVMLAALKGGMNLANLDSDLVESIRSQILTAAQNGEISLPPAWINALDRGAVIHPVFGEESPDPAELTDIMAALGLIANGETPLPSNNGAEETGLGLGVSADLMASVSSGTTSPAQQVTQQAIQQTTVNGTAPAPSNNAGYGVDLKGMTANAETTTGQADGKPQTPQPGPSVTGTGAGAKGSSVNEALAPHPRSETPNTANASQAAAQSAGAKPQGAAGNGANPDSNGQGGNGNNSNGPVENQGQTAPSSKATERSGHPFLARLESMLEARGLAIGSPFAQATGLTGTGDDSLVQGVGGSQTSMSATQQAASTALGASNTPAMTSWSPVAGQVSVQIARQAREGSQEFTIRLDPPELGRVNIKLDIAHDGKVNAVISVDNEKTLQLLQRDQSLLERALADAGLQADSGSLNFSMNGNNGSDKDSDMADDVGQPPNGAPSADDTTPQPGSLAADMLMISDRPLDITV